MDCVGSIPSFSEYGPVYEKSITLTASGIEKVLDESPVAPLTCSQFDVVVTAFDRSAGPGAAAALTLRGGCYHNEVTAALLGAVDFDRRATHSGLSAELRLENQEGLWLMRLYVRVRGLRFIFRHGNIPILRDPSDPEQLKNNPRWE